MDTPGGRPGCVPRGQPLPGPPGRFLVGNTVDYESDRVGFLLRAQREYGDVFRYDRNTVVLLDPEVIDELLLRRNREFRIETPLLIRSESMDRTARITRAATAGRRPRLQGLHRRVVSAHAVRMIEGLERLVRDLDDNEVNVLAVMREFSARTVTDLCIGDTDSAMANAVLNASNSALLLMNARQLARRWIPSRRLASMVRSRKAQPAADVLRDFSDMLLDPEPA